MTTAVDPVPADRAPAAAPPERATDRGRLVALDAIRGLAIVILLVASHPGPRAALPEQLKHPEWHGLTFADLFFPVFLFAAGASIPFSTRSNEPRAVIRRAVLLLLIGIALVSVNARGFHIPGVLQHIALAYLLAWLVTRLPVRAQVAIAGAALVAYWAALIAFADGPDPYSQESGFVHTVNEALFGGSPTEGLPQSAISFVNVLAGVWCSRLVLEQPDPRRVVRTAGLWALLLVGGGLAISGWVPINKRLWSPSFALVSGGASIAFFTVFAWVLEVKRRRAWAQPLVELGSNAIGVYIVVVMFQKNLKYVRDPIDRFLADLASPTVVTLGWSTMWLLLGWLACRALYRRKLFFKV